MLDIDRGIFKLDEGGFIEIKLFLNYNGSSNSW